MDNFIAYEYKVVECKKEEESKYKDIYEALGYEVVDSYLSPTKKVIINLKRDRKIKNHNEIKRLEKEVENYLEKDKELNKSKTRKGNIFSYIFGTISVLIMGVGLSITLSQKTDNLTIYIVGIILGVIGIVLSISNYFINRSIVNKSTKKVLPLIEENEENLINCLEKSDNLVKESFR